jgi:hypothetical protein
MDSYYETHPEDFGSLENVIVKIWPVSIQSINIERAVLLERDFESQMQSMKEQYSKEILNGSVIDYSVDQLYEACIAALDMITFPVLRVNTEDLDDEIGNIVDWMEYKRWH